LHQAKNAAEQKVQLTNAELASLANEEQEAITSWAVNGEGKQPQPRTDERRKLEKCIEDAEREIGQIEAALRSHDANIQPLRDQAASVGQTVRHLALQALYAEAEVLGEKYKDAMVLASVHFAELLGLNEALAIFRDSPVAVRPGIGTLKYPAICHRGGAVDYTIITPGFWLECMSGADVKTVVPGNAIAEAAKRWLRKSMAFQGTSV
jgi:hypothetical protein